MARTDTCDMCGKTGTKENPVKTLELGKTFFVESDNYDLCLMCRQGIKGDIEDFRNMDKHNTEVSLEEEKELLK